MMGLSSIVIPRLFLFCYVGGVLQSVLFGEKYEKTSRSPALACPVLRLRNYIRGSVPGLPAPVVVTLHAPRFHSLSDDPGIGLPCHSNSASRPRIQMSSSDVCGGPRRWSPRSFTPFRQPKSAGYLRERTLLASPGSRPVPVPSY